MTVRVRYAPSPTGEPHVGNIRTALFNWLFARHEGGRFVVRIEDTDQTRLVPGALEAILDALRWLGLDWDEGPEVGGPYGPYFQSQRLPHYRRAAEQLLAAGQAYHCYCSPERLEEMRREQTARKEPPRYDRRCRDLSEGERRELEAQAKAVVRFRTPLAGQTTFHDLLRGDITFENAVLDDFVILKSDGFPTYHLANVVDDDLMRISHVLRADEWLPSTPRHVLLYGALGLTPPAFAHLPIIVGSDRAKLSKRHGAVSIDEYRRQGFLPEAMFNFLGLLGWSLDDRTEIISRQQFIENFSLERVGVTAATFDLEKLTWMNGVYIRQLSLDDLTDRLLPFLERELSAEAARLLNRDYLLRITPLIQERIKRLSEAADLVAPFFLERDLEYDEVASRILQGNTWDWNFFKAQGFLELARRRLLAVGVWESEALEDWFRSLAHELGLKTGDLFGLVRVAETGRTAAPPLFQTMAVLDRDRSLRRMGVAAMRNAGPPALPTIVTGTVLIDGVPAGAGKSVVALIDGTNAGSTATESGGRYTLQVGGRIGNPEICDQAGATIRFLVDGTPVPETTKRVQAALVTLDLTVRARPAAVPLVAGLNPIASPVSGPLPDVISSIRSRLQAIFWWSAAAQSWAWFFTDAPPGANTLNALTAGQIYFFIMSGPASWP